MFGNYFQQTTFSDAFFLGALRVNYSSKVSFTGPVWFDPPADGYDATEVMEHMTRLDKVLFELNATSENGVHYELVQSRPSGPLQFAVKDNYLRLAPGTDRKSLDVENPNTTLIYLLQFRYSLMWWYVSATNCVYII